MFETLGDTLINHGIRHRTSENSSVSTTLSIDYRRRFAKPKRTASLRTSGSYNTSQSISYNYMLNNFISNTDTINQKITSNSNRYHWSATASYTEPLPLDFILELSYNLSSGESKTENLSNNFNLIDSIFNQKDTINSNTFGNYTFNQRFDARFIKSEGKYTYSFGLGLQPSHTTNFIEGQSDIVQNILDFTPGADFRYKFSQRSTLNVRYSGRTQQPTTEQLAPIPNNTDLLNIRVGNPDLKPAFHHNFGVSHNQSFENFSSINVSINFSLTQNPITNVSIYNPDLFPNITLDSTAYRPGVRVIMADNMDPVYRGNVGLHYYTPIVTQKFTFSSSSSFVRSHSKTIVDKDVNELDFSSLWLHTRLTYDFGKSFVSLHCNYTINNTTYSLQPERDYIIQNWSYGPRFNWQIIKDKLMLSSDLQIQRITGYTDGFNPNNTMWNAQLVYTIGKTKAGQLSFQVVDILNDRKDTERFATGNTIQYTTTNILQRYFLVSFTYNLNPAKRAEAREEREK
jgi:hypothetical protein